MSEHEEERKGGNDEEDRNVCEGGGSVTAHEDPAYDPIIGSVDQRCNEKPQGEDTPLRFLREEGPCERVSNDS